MPPLSKTPACGGNFNGSGGTFVWNNKHLTHSAVQAINWKVKVGSTQNGSNYYQTASPIADPGGDGTATIQDPNVANLPGNNTTCWVTPMYQKADQLWYNGSTCWFKST